MGINKKNVGAGGTGGGIVASRGGFASTGNAGIKLFFFTKI